MQPKCFILPLRSVTCSPLTRPAKLHQTKTEDFALRGPFVPISQRFCA